VFPAEVADFPLADAVRRGVVAPLRALRVKPGASLRNVPVVGGDYDQRALAEALDHEALNMAAAMLYRDRFDHRAGIVYAAGVDHAERVAAAMRAAGLRARSVSGRTPPRALAATLAAYERGDINVLVNAQLLAEGWNAPRATICMHLAPTASRRVYQQRIGRVMRLHRRKEAARVVDFVDPAAPALRAHDHPAQPARRGSLQAGCARHPEAAAPVTALAAPGAAGAAGRRMADPCDGRPRPPPRGHR
jgi:superfamily II DNA or RNA helicase